MLISYDLWISTWLDIEFAHYIIVHWLNYSSQWFHLVAQYYLCTSKTVYYLYKCVYTLHMCINFTYVRALKAILCKICDCNHTYSLKSIVQTPSQQILSVQICQEASQSAFLWLVPVVMYIVWSTTVGTFSIFSCFNLLFCYFQNPVKPAEACKGPRGIITQYQIRFQSGSTVITENMNISRCTAGRCIHIFEPPTNLPSSHVSVSVAAGNIVGLGPARTCTAQLISKWQNKYFIT